jgi:hypothetical protein
METIKKTEAYSILQIKPHTLKNLIKSRTIIEINNKEVSLESVLKCKKEFEERRSVNAPNWINAGGYGSI